MIRWWLLALAWLHLSNRAVCEMSRDKGPYDDYHDWTDSEHGPWHFAEHHCTRCDKGFFI